MDPRAKLVISVVGVAVLVFGYVEWSLGRNATAQPVHLNLADLEKSPVVTNNHVTIDEHIRLYSGCVYSYRTKKGETGSPSPTTQVSYAYYPIISLNNPHRVATFNLARKYGGLDKIPEAEAAPPPHFAVVVKTKAFETVGDIPSANEKAAAVTGLVVNDIESLSSKEQELIRQSFPSIDFASVLILEEGRKPTSRTHSQATMAVGGLLILLGLAWAFGSHFSARPSEPFCQSCGTEAPTHHVHFFQNIGALMIRYSRQVDADLCKSCIHRFFWTFTPITFFVGWWGVISMMLTPLTLLNNFATYLLCLPMPSVPLGAVRPVLDANTIEKLKPQTEQIFAQLASNKTLTEVAVSTATQTGVSAGQVILWVRSILTAQAKKK